MADGGSMGSVGKATVDIAADMSRLDKDLATLPGKVNKATRPSAMGFLYLSQAIEDCQFGFSSIVNNIPGMVMAFGGGAGLAGGLSIAAVAVNVLINNWGKLATAFGEGHVKTQAEAMEELSKKTGKTADETLRLMKYERERSTIEAQRASRGEIEEKQAKGVGEAVAELGHDRMVKGLTDTSRDELIATSADARNARDAVEKHIDGLLPKYRKADGSTGSDYTPEQRRYYADKRGGPALAGLEAKLNDAVHKAAEKQLSDAANDPTKLKNLQKKVDANPGAFPKDSGARLREQTPEAIAAREEEERAAAAKADREKDNKERRKDREKRTHDAAVKAATEGGHGLDIDLLSGNPAAKDKLRKGLVGTGMDAANAESVAAEAIKVRKEKLLEAKRGRVLSGLAATPEAADRQLLAEAKTDQAAAIKANARKQLGEKMTPEIMDLGGYLNKIQTEGRKLEEQAIEVAERTNTILEGIAKDIAKGPGAARFGRRGG